MSTLARAVHDFAKSTFQTYRRELRRYLMRRLRRPEDVDDLAQEVFERLCRLDEEKCVEKPLAYIYGIASHVLADYCIESDQERKHVTVDSELAEEWYDMQIEPGDLAERLNLQQQIDRAMAQLPPTHAAVLLAHKRDGLSYEECADKLGLSIFTVEKYVSQSKARIRTMTWER